MKFTKKDLFSSLITGFYTGLIAWQILVFLGKPSVMGYSFGWLMVIVPILWIFGVNLGYFLGRWIVFFNQFGKFAAIGFTNADVDFGVLNLLIAWSSVATGILYAVFKTISFIVSVTHSYYWNRQWVFQSQSQEKGKEFFDFISVYIVAWAINVGAATAVVTWVDPMFGLSQNAWANVGAIAGSAVALAFSFTGVRTFVFKKK